MSYAWPMCHLSLLFIAHGSHGDLGNTMEVQDRSLGMGEGLPKEWAID